MTKWFGLVTRGFSLSLMRRKSLVRTVFLLIGHMALPPAHWLGGFGATHMVSPCFSPQALGSS